MAQRAHEPLTSERLAGIAHYLDNRYGARWNRQMEPIPYGGFKTPQDEMVGVLLAEVERLRAALAAAEAREAAWREVGQTVAEGWPSDDAFIALRKRASALLAATEAGEP